MSSDYSITTLKRAEVRRQKILDMLHATPGMGGGDIVIAMPEYTFESIRGAIANMLAKREIAGTWPKRAQTYIALVKTTESAESVRAARLARTKEHNKRNRDPEYQAAYREKKRQAEAKRAQRKHEAKLAAEPWRTIHIVRADDPPLKNQGGQGALRRDVTVNCGQNY